MATLNKNRSAQQYAQALTLLLPPGEYFSTGPTQQLMDAESQELARIDGYIDNEFQVPNSTATASWTLQGYRDILAAGGLTDFTVTDKEHLHFGAGDTIPNELGDEDNVSTIYIKYPIEQTPIFSQLVPQLRAHKLIFTRIIANTPSIVGIRLPAVLPATFKLISDTTSIV